MYISHFLHRFQPKDGEAGVKNACCGFTQENPWPVNFDNVATLVFFYAVTFLVELCEGICNLIHKLTERVKQQIFCHPGYHLTKPKMFIESWKAMRKYLMYLRSSLPSLISFSCASLRPCFLA